jgi:hypothetical protein
VRPAVLQVTRVIDVGMTFRSVELGVMHGDPTLNVVFALACDPAHGQGIPQRLHQFID